MFQVHLKQIQPISKIWVVPIIDPSSMSGLMEDPVISEMAALSKVFGRSNNRPILRWADSWRTQCQCLSCLVSSSRPHNLLLVALILLYRNFVGVADKLRQNLQMNGTEHSSSGSSLDDDQTISLSLNL